VGSRSRTQLLLPRSSNACKNNKVNQLSGVKAFSAILAAVSLVFVFALASSAQVSSDHAQPAGGNSVMLAVSQPDVSVPSSYAISVAQLRIPAKAVRHLELAAKRFNRMDIRGAENEIDRVLEIDPACSLAFSMRSLMKLAETDSNGAIEDAARAVQLDAHDAHALLTLATAYNNVGEFAKAADAARRAVGMEPEIWQSRLELAKSLYGQGQLAEALTALGLVNKDFPDVHLVRADVLMQMGRALEAAKEFEAFLKQAPNDPRGTRIREIVAAVQ
jgi:tetratricopeptide (TPR) repeat protein